MKVSKGPGLRAADTRDVPRRVDATLDDIEVYDRNPRKSDNRKFEDIKEGIRALGLEQEWTLTKRHAHDPKYIIKAGGGTRYRACRELWQETGDERYYRFNCKYVPWDSELNTLVSHISENDNRSSLLYVERALSAIEIAGELQSRSETPLSFRELAKQITALGWRVGHSPLSYYDYTVNVLLPVLPRFFYAGAGRPRVEELRAIENDYCTFIAQARQSSTQAAQADFRPLFSTALATLDGEQLDIHALTEHLDTAVGALLGCSAESVGYRLSSEKLLDHKDTRFVPGADERPAARETAAPDGPVEPTRNAATPGHPDQPTTPSPRSGDQHVETQTHRPAERVTAYSAEQIQVELNRLRRRAQTLALDLVKDYQLISSYAMAPDEAYFLGFVISEPPTIDPVEQWRHGVVYWRLYHLFYAAYQTEKVAGLLDDLDLLDFDRRYGLSSVWYSPAFEEEGLLHVQWRSNDLMLRSTTETCSTEDRHMAATLSELDGLLLQHYHWVQRLPERQNTDANTPS